MKIVIPTFLIFTLLGLGAGPARGQQPPQVPKIGLLVSGSPSPGHLRNRAAFLKGLRELGYTEGKNILFVYRHAYRKRELLPGLAAELVELGVAVIVPSGPTAVGPAMKATKTIPIVMPNGSGDPVRRGFVKSLSRPGGNVTGLLGAASGIWSKRIELLRETLPRVDRIAVLYPDPVRKRRMKAYKRAAKKLGLDIEFVGLRGDKEIESAFAAIVALRPDALITVRHTLTLGLATQIAEFAIQEQLPSMSEQGHYVRAGGLMSYAVSHPATWHRAAVYVDKILKGADPADLPVEPPPRLEFVINLKTAKKIGVTIPPEILLEANEVIK